MGLAVDELRGVGREVDAEVLVHSLLSRCPELDAVADCVALVRPVDE